MRVTREEQSLDTTPSPEVPTAELRTAEPHTTEPLTTGPLTTARKRAPRTPRPRPAKSATTTKTAEAEGEQQYMIGRIPVLDVSPRVDCGSRPAKSVVGEPFEVSATVFREGHDAVGANVVLRDPKGRSGPWTPMRELAPGTDRLGAEVVATSPGRWTFTVEAWSDPFATWRHAAEIKVPAGIDTELVLEEGALLLERAAPGVPVREGRAQVRAAAKTLRRVGVPATERLAAALAEPVLTALTRYPLRELVSASRPAALQVDRERALYGSWYEFFPRSEGAVVDREGRRPPVSGTLRTAAERLPAVAAMGFDVVYLPPIHPIGRAYRKGPNNSLEAGPHDVGSPWAIGSPEGGHDAIHPDLGTIGDFDAFVARARELGLEVAIDLALQASPDHPWVTEHPEWFTTRADGSIAYAENPPKKYQDIYPVNFDHDLDGLYAETLRIVRYWMSHGVRIFRVDNPHTKPLPFWERLLAEVARTDPDVIFLAEAFTRPAMMHALAMIGFHQSYTYFTWRNTKEELAGYLAELAGPDAAIMRPNFFANTPDILTEYLQHGGPPAFKIRAVLAATLAPSWGIYSGYELCENVPIRPGSEEYMDSEKFQYRPRDWSAAYREPSGIAPFITRLNSIRKGHPALHWLRNLRFHHIDQPALLCFSKRTGTDTVLVVVNLDPHQPHEATAWLDAGALGLEAGSEFTVTDELTGESYRWGQANYVRLDPATSPAHIFTVTAGTPDQ
jgi:starch synthase (maltosyl-transferring)